MKLVVKTYIHMELVVKPEKNIYIYIWSLRAKNTEKMERDEKLFYPQSCSILFRNMLRYRKHNNPVETKK
jgi:hypothetical protein